MHVKYRLLFAIVIMALLHRLCAIRLTFVMGTDYRDCISDAPLYLFNDMGPRKHEGRAALHHSLILLRFCGALYHWYLSCELDLMVCQYVDAPPLQGEKIKHARVGFVLMMMTYYMPNTCHV
jgi:hypothetical protein